MPATNIEMRSLSPIKRNMKQESLNGHVELLSLALLLRVSLRGAIKLIAHSGTGCAGEVRYFALCMNASALLSIDFEKGRT
jgi:hypothetical protein